MAEIIASFPELEALVMAWPGMTEAARNEARRLIGVTV